MINQKTLFRGLARFFLAGILLFNSVAIGAARGGKNNPSNREVSIGLRLPDGRELHFNDCARLERAVENGELSSSGSGCLGLTPLHLAVARHPDKIAALLDAGANPNAKTPDGLTPLHLAAQSGSYDVVLILLAEGADPLATLSNDKTALHVLYSPSSCTSCERKEQQEVSRKEIATRFVKAGVSPDTRDTAEASALHYAVMRPDAQEATVELLSLGADPRTRDHEGVPVSFYASLAGNTAAAELTRLAAADSVNTVDPEGKTKEEWISAKRTEMDASRYSSKPEIITGPAAFATAGVRFEYGCHYWLGMGCAVVGTIGCYVGCSFITGPFAFLCGPLCSVGAYAGCWEAVELICGPG